MLNKVLASFQSSEDGIAQDKLLIGNSQELNYSVCATSILTCCMHFYVSFSFISSFESWIVCTTCQAAVRFCLILLLCFLGYVCFLICFAVYVCDICLVMCVCAVCLVMRVCVLSLVMCVFVVWLIFMCLCC